MRVSTIASPINAAASATGILHQRLRLEPHNEQRRQL
jgi:hypothetical protein